MCLDSMNCDILYQMTQKCKQLFFLIERFFDFLNKIKLKTPHCWFRRRSQKKYLKTKMLVINKVNYLKILLII